MSLEIYSKILPAKYNFQKDFLVAIETKIDLMPWRFFALDSTLDVMQYYYNLKAHYGPDRLLPFAYIYDPTGYCEDGSVVHASFDLCEENVVRIFHTAYPKNSPWDNKSYCSFSEWLEMAQVESKQYKSDMAEIATYEDT